MKNLLKRLLFKIHYLRVKYIGKPTFLIIASILVGIASSLTAIMLKRFVALVRSIADYYSDKTSLNFWFFIMPLIGVILTVIIVKYLFKGKIDKGIGFVLDRIVNNGSKMPKETMYSNALTSGITVGFGGSVGLEASIVITGSSIGSNIASILELDEKERVLLLACGAASGIAAIFNSPIAGVIFAIEVLLTNISIPAFIPILISTASATIVSKLLYSGQIFHLIMNDWAVKAIPFYILLGILCGLISVYMTRTTFLFERVLKPHKSSVRKALIAGSVLGLVIFSFPPLFGEGYRSIELLLNGRYTSILNYSFFEPYSSNPWMVLVFCGLIIVMKVIATSLTVCAGGNGGIFAPSLFTGSFTGFMLANFVNTLGITELYTVNFIVVGMAGIISGVIHAPLTAIFLIAEITGGYVLIIPLMIVSAISFFIARYFEPHSIYTKGLKKLL